MSESRHVLIRADGGHTIGWGHIVRCLSIANDLNERGAVVSFATAAPQVIRDRIVAHGYEVTVLDHAQLAHPIRGAWGEDAQRQDCRDTFDGQHVDTVLVDHYGLDATWEQQARSHVSKIAVVDDLANRAHDCDLLFDHNWYGPHNAARYDALVPPHCVLHLGPLFAPLQSAYRSVKRSQPAQWPPKRVVVSFGGSDPTNETAKALEAASQFGDLEVDVVLGSSAADDAEAALAKAPRVRVHRNLPTLAHLLVSADLAIGASGTGTWERIATTVPAVVATQTEAHSGVTAALHDQNITTWVGTMDQTTSDDYLEVLGRAVLQPAPRIVDGFGAARIAEAMCPSADDAVQLRALLEQDLAVFLDVALPTNLVGSWRDHDDAFQQRRRDFVRVDVAGCPIGVVPKDDAGEPAVASWHPLASAIGHTAAVLPKTHL